MSGTYLAFDLSTQRIKAVVIDENLTVQCESHVQFDSQLPEFRTQGGVLRGPDGQVTSPVLMWIKALDLILDQLQLDGVDFSSVRAISGTAQQHGTVYWQNGAKTTLNNLNSNLFLHQQLQTCFSLKECPIWMDSSTTDYCDKLERNVGGPQKLAEITGSKGYERFSASQIAKIIDKRKTVYDNSERISLVSSFLGSIFLGDYCSIDYTDGSGMNLMNITTKEWSAECIEALSLPEDIKHKLGDLVPPHTIVGDISDYFVQRFGFNSKCKIISFTGDNPASFAGMCLREHDIAVSLGTSDTLILSLNTPRCFTDGHVMCSPVSNNEYFSLLCFKNGSLTRERIRNDYSNSSWEEFNELLKSTPRGNFGNVGLYFDNQEILPFLPPGDYRWNSRGEKLIKFAGPEFEIRALIEGQFLARRAFAEDIGLSFGNETGRIIATGGASSNVCVLQVLADVFNLPVYVQDCSNSAVLGAAYLAKLACNTDLVYADIEKMLPAPKLVCAPSKDASQIYDQMLQRFRILISNIVQSS